MKQDDRKGGSLRPCYKVVDAESAQKNREARWDLASPELALVCVVFTAEKRQKTRPGRPQAPAMEIDERVLKIDDNR